MFILNFCFVLFFKLGTYFPLVTSPLWRQKINTERHRSKQYFLKRWYILLRMHVFQGHPYLPGRVYETWIASIMGWYQRTFNRFSIVIWNESLSEHSWCSRGHWPFMHNVVTALMPLDLLQQHHMRVNASQINPRGNSTVCSLGCSD